MGYTLCNNISISLAKHVIAPITIWALAQSLCESICALEDSAHECWLHDLMIYTMADKMQSF